MKITCPKCKWSNFYWIGTIFGDHFILQCTMCKNVYVYEVKDKELADKIVESLSFIPQSELIIEEE